MGMYLVPHELVTHGRPNAVPPGGPLSAARRGPCAPSGPLPSLSSPPAPAPGHGRSALALVSHAPGDHPWCDVSRSPFGRAVVLQILTVTSYLPGRILGISSLGLFEINPSCTGFCVGVSTLFCGIKAPKCHCGVTS